MNFLSSFGQIMLKISDKNWRYCNSVQVGSSSRCTDQKKTDYFWVWRVPEWNYHIYHISSIYFEINLWCILNILYCYSSNLWDFLDFNGRVYHWPLLEKKTRDLEEGCWISESQHLFEGQRFEHEATCLDVPLKVLGSQVRISALF